MSAKIISHEVEDLALDFTIPGYDIELRVSDAPDHFRGPKPNTFVSLVEKTCLSRLLTSTNMYTKCSMLS